MSVVLVGPPRWEEVVPWVVLPYASLERVCTARKLTIAMTKLRARFSKPNSLATASEQRYDTAVMNTNSTGMIASSTIFASVSWLASLVKTACVSAEAGGRAGGSYSGKG